MHHVGKPLVARFAKRTPVNLFRIQVGVNVKLRAHADQLAAGRSSYDIKVHDGLVQSFEPAESRFMGPNGMSLRPAGPMFGIIVGTFKSNPKLGIYEIPEGTPIPDNLALLHEHSDHFSLQPAVPMTLVELNRALTAFLQHPSVRRFPSKATFWAAFPDMSPEAVGCDHSSP